MSFYHIYFCGTFVIFSSVIGRKGFGEGLGKGAWMNSAWQALGRADKRYLETDVYLICLYGVLALVVSPLLLFYGWSTYVRAPHRHLSGIVASSMMIYTKILYFGVEMMPWEKSFNFQSDPGGVTALIVLECVFEIFLPLLIIYREVIGNMKGISRADTQQLLLLMNQNIATDGVSGKTGTYMNTTESEINSQLYSYNGEMTSRKTKSRSSSVTSTKAHGFQTLNIIPEGRDKARLSARKVSFDYSYHNKNDGGEDNSTVSGGAASQCVQHRPRGSTATEVEVEGRGERSFFSPSSRFMDSGSENMDYEARRSKRSRPPRKRSETTSLSNSNKFSSNSNSPSHQLHGRISQTVNAHLPEERTSVTPEALLSALTMSMADNASSLAMVV